MADEQKVVVELIDRSGPGAAATSPLQPGSAEVPGASLARDFNQQITEQGAGAKAGAGAATPSPTPVTSPTSPAAPTPTPSGVQRGDPLLSTVQGILSADPNTTQQELQQALGITSGRAASLLAASRDSARASEEQAKASSSSDTTEIPKPSDTPSDSATPRELYQFAERIRKEQQTPHEAFDERARYLRDALDANLITQEHYDKGLREAQERFSKEFDLDPSKVRLEEPVVAKVVPPDNPDTAGTRNIVDSLVGNISQMAAMAGGPLGGVAGRALATAAPAVTPALSSLLPALSTPQGALAVAGIGATIGLPFAAVAALQNEANRAQAVIGNLSPEVAAARAEAQVQQIRANLRSAERLGDETAQYIESSGRYNRAAQEARDITSEPFLDRWGEWMEVFGTALEIRNKFVLEPMFKVINGLKDSIDELTGVDGLSESLKKLRDFLGIRDERMGRNAFTWFGTLQHLDPPEGFRQDIEQAKRPADFAPIPGLKL